MALERPRAVVGLAAAQLRGSPSRTALAVAGVALAVLATTLLASVGAGVLATGEQKLDASGRDVWVTGGPLRLAADGSGVENGVLDAHRVAESISRRPPVAEATPIAFQAVYAGTSPDDLRLLTGVGIPDAHAGISIREGSSFAEGDVHYAGGAYDGPMTYSAIVDPRTASLFDVGVGDALYVGGSRAAARDHRFRVVGVSPDFSRFVGTPTVALHLSELQEVTGAAGTDRATLIAVRLVEGADTAAVAATLEREYPRYDVRTNREQLRAVLGENAVVLASAGVLVALAVLAGVALTVNLLALVVYQQRRELAALRALGLSGPTVVGLVAVQGLLLGAAGGALGLAATPVGALALDALAARVVGFESLVWTPAPVYLAGGGVALGIGILGAAVAGWQVARLPPLAQLER